MSSKMHFDTEFSFEKSIHILHEVSCELLGEEHPYVRCIERGDYYSLADNSVDYSRAPDANAVRRERQVLAFFQKNASLPLNINTKDVAYQKFLESEDQCREMNRLLIARATRESLLRVDAPLHFAVMRKVSEIIGPMPDLDELDFGFGPGANVGLSRLTSVRRKFSARPTCTASATKYLKYLRQRCPHWETLERVEPTMHGNLAFVPKSAKTDRSIVVEPLLNTFLQKGVGAWIRQRLKKFGCNLNSQARNQRLALIGSIDGSLATIDLQSASDTISREVVKELLPYDWWLMMEDIRSSYVKTPDGKVLYLEKFSSMGNGFTFELESLIFLSIAQVVCPRGSTISVYGDDIIVPAQSYDLMITALEQFGFTVNSAKSFATGKFRESCGKDYFGGIDVRPCYVKGKLSVKELFRLHNFFIRSGEDGLASVLIKYIPKRFRIFGPDGFGDGHLLGDHPRRLHNKQRGWGGYRFKTYTTKPFQRRDPLDGDYTAFLYLNTEKCAERELWSFARDGTICPGSISTDGPSATMYQERSFSNRYRLSSIYTWV